MSLMTRCINCQGTLAESGATQCEKCHKNELKYGKPTTCRYCKLLAAFSEEKCVYCCYSERKHGPPVKCAHCQMKSAFTRHTKKATLCRLCIMTARQQGKHEMSGVPIPKEKEHRSSLSKPSSSHGKKRMSEPPTKKDSDTPLKQPRLDTTVLAVNSQNVVQIQELQEKVEECQKTIALKDKLLLRKDAEIAQLKADMSSSERKYRDIIAQLNKEKEEAVQTIHHRYREQNRQERQEKQEREQKAQREKERKEREKKAKKEKDRKEAEEKTRRERLAAEKLAEKDKENDLPTSKPESHEQEPKAVVDVKKKRLMDSDDEEEESGAEAPTKSNGDVAAKEEDSDKSHDSNADSGKLDESPEEREKTEEAGESQMASQSSPGDDDDSMQIAEDHD